jgi:hypothetical protein
MVRLAWLNNKRCIISKGFRFFASRAKLFVANVSSDSSQLPDSTPLDEVCLRLDPAVFPRRLELTLSAQAHELLLQLASECGRSPGELAEHLISQSLKEGRDGR